jgi:hypothetical protein
MRQKVLDMFGQPLFFLLYFIVFQKHVLVVFYNLKFSQILSIFFFFVILFQIFINNPNIISINKFIDIHNFKYNTK